MAVLRSAKSRQPIEARLRAEGRPVSDASCSNGRGRIGGFIHPGMPCRVGDVVWWTVATSAQQEPWLFDRSDQRCSTAAIELLGILIGMKIAKRLDIHGIQAGFYVEAWTDSEAAARATRRWYSARPPMLRILRELAVICWRTRSEAWIEHVPGSKNLWADFLSRHDAEDIIKAGFDPAKRQTIDMAAASFWELPFDLPQWMANWERRGGI